MGRDPGGRPRRSTSSVEGAQGTTMILRSAFQRLTAQDLDRLRQIAHVTTYPPDTVLCREGDIDRTVYVVRSGMVGLSKRVSATEERLLMVRGVGELFGETSLLDDTPRMATARTVGEVSVIEITKADFAQLMEQSPTLAMTLLQQSQTDLRALMQSQIKELQQVNRSLAAAYQKLEAAQAQLVAGEIVKRDLEIAAQIQRSILPSRFPSVLGYTFAGLARPARQMGGDFYDVYRLDEDHVGLLVADVSDKGVPAALFMGVARTLFLTESRRSLSPLTVAKRVNDLLLEAASNDLFVTAFYGVVDLRTGRLSYVRAGHDLPLLQHADGTAEPLTGAGRFLGMIAGLEAEERTVQLHPGDRLLLFSDGVTDANDRGGARYTRDRLEALVSMNRALSAAELTERIVTDVTEFQGDAPQFDDITLLVTAVG